MTNARKERIAEEFYHRRNAGEIISRKSIAEWAFEELKLSFMPTQSTISRLLKAKSNSDEASINLVKKRKTDGA